MQSQISLQDTFVFEQLNVELKPLVGSHQQARARLDAQERVVELDVGVEAVHVLVDRRGSAYKK